MSGEGTSRTAFGHSQVQPPSYYSYLLREGGDKGQSFSGSGLQSAQATGTMLQCT